MTTLHQTNRFQTDRERVPSCRSAAAAPPLALPLSVQGIAAQGTKLAGHQVWGALPALLCALLLRGSLSKRRARPQQFRGNARKAPEAGRLRPVPAWAAWGE